MGMRVPNSYKGFLGKYVSYTDFWQRLDELIKNHTLVIDRPKGAQHPQYPEVIYPIDYGYLKGVLGTDGNDIDVWVGSMPARALDAIVCTVDLLKKDTEFKLLLGCTKEEKEAIVTFHNNKYMSGILIERL